MLFIYADSDDASIDSRQSHIWTAMQLCRQLHDMLQVQNELEEDKRLRIASASASQQCC